MKTRRRKYNLGLITRSEVRTMP